MKITVEVSGGVLQWQTVPKELKDGKYEVILHNLDTRTGRQNSSLHMWLTMIAKALNDAGLDIGKTIKADIPWSMETVKSLMWHRIQGTVTKKKSSANLTKEEFANIQEVLNRVLGDRYGIHVPFPSMEGKENEN